MLRLWQVMAMVAFAPALATALCSLSLLLGAGPAVAQDVQPVPLPEVDAEAPLDPMTDLGLAWPDMAAPDSADEDIAAIADNADQVTERPYRVVLEGGEGLSATPVAERFNSLSTLKAGEKDKANSAQINRRIREDSVMLDTILRASGYYDAQIDSQVDTPTVGPLLVKLIITPGPLYRFDQVKVSGLEGTGDRAPDFNAVLGLGEQDAVDADDVTGGATALEKTMLEQGYPFAKVSEPEITIDHETRLATMAISVDPGGARKFGQVIVTGEKPPFGASHVDHIARFRPGEPYDQAHVDDLRRALIATGVASSVSVAPIPAADPSLADIQVTMRSAPFRTIAGELGYGTGEGARAEASWTHRNLLGPEGALTARAVIGTKEQEGGLVVRKSNFYKRDVVLNARLLASNTDQDAYDARTIELGFGLERQSNIIWQKRWTWSGGVELLATDERDMTANVLSARRRTYLLAVAPASLGYDRSNDLLDPTRGFRLGVRVAPEISLRNGTNAYVRMQLDGSAYVPASDTVTVAGRVRMGTIMGAGTLDLAPSRRFYAGGGSSVRGFGYQQIGPRDAANDPVGGRSLAEFSLEARVRWRDFGFVPFIDGGNIYSRAAPKLSNFRYGAGLGLRYHSAFGPIRIDVGTPINPRAGDARVTVFVSLGQAF